MSAKPENDGWRLSFVVFGLMCVVSYLSGCSEEEMSTDSNSNYTDEQRDEDEEYLAKIRQALREQEAESSESEVHASISDTPELLNCDIQIVDINCGAIGYQGGCSPVWSKTIVCNVKDDGVTLQEVQLNRGRCEPNLIGGMDKTYNFGDKFQVGTGLCNLLEFSVTANGITHSWELTN